MSPAAVRRPGRHPAWGVFGVTALTLVAAAGIGAAPAVLVVPLEESLGWSRSTISLAISVNLLLLGFTGPFAAALMQRFGLRRVVCSALGVMGTAVLLSTQMQAPWQFVLLWGVMVGAGAGCMASVFAATVAGRWFVHRRGLVTGVLVAASATGQLIFLPVLGRISEQVGWRWVAVVAAAAAFAVVPLVWWRLVDRPEDVGAVPYGAPPGTHSPEPEAHPVALARSALRDARRSGAFWLLAGSFFVCGASTNGLVGTHFVAAGMDHGMRESTAAGLLALVGVFDVVGTICSGWLTDRFGPRVLLCGYYALRGAALLLLDHALAAQRVPLAVFMVVYGLDWVATVPPTVALTTQIFGPERGSVVYGWVFAGHQVGAASAAWFAGASHGWTGSYSLAFTVSGALCFVAAAASLRIGRARPDHAPGLAPAVAR